MFHRRQSDQISLAVEAHGRWRLEFRRAVMGADLGKPAAEIADDHACAFGTWLHGPEVDAATRETPAWRVIARLHQAFHQSAGAVAKLVEQGDLVEAEALLAGDYLARSNRLLAGLRKWRAELAFGAG